MHSPNSQRASKEIFLSNIFWYFTKNKILSMEDGLQTTSIKRKRQKEAYRIGRLPHAQFLRQTEDVRSEQSWALLQNVYLKRETECRIVAARNHSVKTNLTKSRIDRGQKHIFYRLYTKADENINHAVSGCSKLAQKENKKTHGGLGKIIHWELVTTPQTQDVN